VTRNHRHEPGADERRILMTAAPRSRVRLVGSAHATVDEPGLILDQPDPHQRRFAAVSGAPSISHRPEQRWSAVISGCGPRSRRG
jgi:hypothetical protein